MVNASSHDAVGSSVKQKEENYKAELMVKKLT